ncbi:unnamed protein product [Malassezia sympodialis ATCC 42132]|uniref:Protein yippee-like n=1 Tax=Malassezia sympodialis (strain ATCC 42132) TaxID=1230383 RepID=M5ENQ9_MALS4|nr:uncharacterized protein MSY001_2049 [Malassezia sympodialis ATCC 42132]CCU99343.1 unnamed protein product [Malassezia sympodialis ATCC 42132]SHO78631.1 Similar to S.cerevisiae protein MOH1 (Protein of unknown function) [Malassezia sympodialis ATCC 42132]|eukprot:XP_018740597.1 uncharacterized protein MSY001_2049 [Malassezia sympodialis ATCC 42132]
MGWNQRVYLNSAQIYVCKNCKTHLATEANVISKDFSGKLGEAYLMWQVVNSEEDEFEEREMRTGKHVVCDIYCSRCRNYVGWKYCYAFLSSERYKEGKYLLEAARLTRSGYDRDDD